jgi:hypothetical protein
MNPGPMRNGCPSGRASGELALLSVTVIFHPIRGVTHAPSPGELVPDGGRRFMGQTAGFQETLRRVAMIGEGFVEDPGWARLAVLILKLLRCC